MPRPYTIKIFVPAGDPEGIRIIEKRDFWTTCFAFTSKDDNLDKAHVQFLEARLVELAARAKRCTLDNGNAPALPSLSESDAAEAEGFLQEALMCFPVLRLGVFSTAAPPVSTAQQLAMSGRGVKAQGFETAEGFVVLAGSEAVLDEVPSCYPYIVELRAALAKNGVLKTAGSRYTFTQNYVFPSPSSAAGVILGRSANGRDAWKARDGRSLKEFQDAESTA